MFKFPRKKIFLIGAGAGLLIFLHFTGLSRPAENSIRSFLNPVLSRIYFLSSEWNKKYREQASREDLFNKIALLEAQIKKLLAENAGLRALEEENRVLREHLNFSAQNKKPYLLANIVARSDDQSSSFIIDKGRAEGLIAGLAVVDENGVVVGKVAVVRENDAEVYFITNHNCKLAASLEGVGEIAGIARGNLGLTITLEFVPQAAEIKTGQTVITSGLEKNIPRGLVIGKVFQISKENNELWQEVSLEPFFQPGELFVVGIVLP